MPRAHLFAIAFTCLSAAPASSAVQSVLWGRPNMRQDVIELIGRSAEPIVKNVAPGGDIRSLVINQCGRIEPAYVKLLLSLNAGETRNNIDLSSGMLRPRAKSRIDRLVLPACLYATLKSTPYTIKEGDTYPEIAQRFTGFDGAKTASLFRKANRGRNLDSLKPNTTLKIPYIAKATTLTFPDTEHQAEFLSTLASLDDFYPKPAQTQKRVLNSQLKPTKSNVASNVGQCVISPQKIEVDCNGDGVGYPIDAKEIANVLNLLAAQTPMRSRSVVFIIDTGVVGFDNTDFSLNDPQPMPQTFLKDDLNIFTLSNVRFFGMSLDDSAEDMTRPTPTVGDWFWQHGTHISGLIAGNLINSEIRSITTGHIRISAFNATSAEPEQQRSICKASKVYRLRAALVTEAIGRANQLNTSGANSARIINLSLATSRQMYIDDFLLPDNLYVIAAGNENVNFNTDDRRVWPAAYGLKNKGNVIVVAAHDASFKIVPYTDHGSKAIDIAAPGCRIRSLVGSKLDDVAAYDGTSQAAAYVSFAAALLEAQYPDLRSDQIKRRLILTADAKPALTNEVRAKGALNIPKALAVNFDVIEHEVHGSTKRSYGFIGEANDYFSFCPDDKNPWTGNINQGQISRIDLEQKENNTWRTIRVFGEDPLSAEAFHCDVAGKNVEFFEFIRPGVLGSKQIIPLGNITQIITGDPNQRLGQRQGRVESNAK